MKKIRVCAFIMSILLLKEGFVFINAKESNSGIVVYNESIFTTDDDVYFLGKNKNHVEVSNGISYYSNEDNESKFDITTEDQFYYDDGKIVKYSLKEVVETEQVKEKKIVNDNLVESKTADCFATYSVKEKELSKEEINALGLSDANDMVALSSYNPVRFTEEAWNDSVDKCLKVRMTVDYATYPKSGVASKYTYIEEMYGKIVYAESTLKQAGITATMTIKQYGYVYNINTGVASNPEQYYNSKQFSNKATDPNKYIGVGESYYVRMDGSPNGKAYEALYGMDYSNYVSWVVVSRGVTSKVNFWIYQH